MNIAHVWCAQSFACMGLKDTGIRRDMLAPSKDMSFLNPSEMAAASVRQGVEDAARRRGEGNSIRGPAHTQRKQSNIPALRGSAVWKSVVESCSAPRMRKLIEIQWMDDILHHLENPGMMIPLKLPANIGSPWFQSGAGFCLSTVSTARAVRHRILCDAIHQCFPRIRGIDVRSEWTSPENGWRSSG